MSIPNLQVQTESFRPQTIIECKDSFFDDDDNDLDPFDNRRKLWIKPQKTHLNSIKPNTILYEGYMAKKGKKIKLKKMRYYILTSELLAYKVSLIVIIYLVYQKDQSAPVKKIMILERTRLEFYLRPHKIKDPKHGFCFSRNKKMAKVYTRDKEIYEQFKNHLARLCILSSFIEDYNVLKLVGQGSYGKV